MKMLIVGGGLFGKITAAHASSLGYETVIFDNDKKNAGSKPAACLMKPSWMSSVDYKPALKLLEQHFEVKTIPFKVAIVKTDCFWVDPVSILSSHSVVEDTVLEVGDGFVRTATKTVKGLVVVAAGFWSKALLPSMPDIKGMCGSAVHTSGVAKATIHVYAPYRQAVWFNIAEDKVWFGDGTSILIKNFSAEHVARTKARAVDWAKLTPEKVVSGIRPYVVGNAGGFFQKISDKLFVTTGGAKNGTILAASQALALQTHLNTISNS